MTCRFLFLCGGYYSYTKPHMPHFKNQEKFNVFFTELDKKTPIYLYCRSGNRSKKSADILIEMGFSEIYDLKGGFIEWNLNKLKEN